MNKKKTLILSISFGVLGLLLSTLYLNMKESEMSGGKYRRVVVSAVDVKVNKLLEPGLVKYKKIPEKFVEPGAFFDKRSVEGLVTIVPLKAGEQITGSKLSVAGLETGLSSKIPNGKRAVSFEVKKDDAVAGLIKPDDHIDIISILDNNSDIYAFTLFQDVEVLSVNSEINSINNPLLVPSSRKNSSEGMSGMMAIERRGGVVTVALNEADALRLVLAKKAGQLSVHLRSQYDRSKFRNLEPVSLSKMTGEKGLTFKRYREYRGR